MIFTKENLVLLTIAVLAISILIYFRYRNTQDTVVLPGYQWFQVDELNKEKKHLSERCSRGCQGECNFADGSCDCGNF